MFSLNSRKIPRDQFWQNDILFGAKIEFLLSQTYRFFRVWKVVFTHRRLNLKKSRWKYSKENPNYRIHSTSILSLKKAIYKKTAFLSQIQKHFELNLIFNFSDFHRICPKRKLIKIETFSLWSFLECSLASNYQGKLRMDKVSKIVQMIFISHFD